MVDSRRELDSQSLVWVIGGVVDGLAELGAKANGARPWRPDHPPMC